LVVVTAHCFDLTSVIFLAFVFLFVCIYTDKGANHLLEYQVDHCTCIIVGTA
jgi:hypothetical protein